MTGDLGETGLQGPSGTVWSSGNIGQRVVPIPPGFSALSAVTGIAVHHITCDVCYQLSSSILLVQHRSTSHYGRLHHQVWCRLR